MTQSISDQTLGAWVRDCRQRRAMTQQAYAALLGYTVETLRKVERDRYLSRGFVERLAEIEGVPLARLLEFPEVAELFGVDARVSASQALPATTSALARTPRIGMLAGIVAAFVCGMAVTAFVVFRTPQQAIAPTAQSLSPTIVPTFDMPPSATSAPVITATATDAPTEQPTATDAPTSTRAPSETPLPTPTPAPTSTPAPSATPPPSPTASPTPQLITQDLPVPFVGNDDVQTILPGFTTGERVFDGVRFVIPDSRNKLSTECDADRQWPVEVAIPLGEGVPQPEDIYMLLNAGFPGHSEGSVIGQVELVFTGQSAPPAYQLVLGDNIRHWLMDHGPVAFHSPDLREVYRGDSSYNVEGVIDMLHIAIPAEYRNDRLQTIIVRDVSRTTVGSPDPCLFTVGITIRARIQ